MTYDHGPRIRYCRNTLQTQKIYFQWNTWKKSSFVILHDYISELLEAETFPSDESDTVMNAVTMYKSCLDMRTIEQLATAPIIEMVNMYGGWPMINPNWNSDRYNIMDVVGRLSHLGVGVFINSQVVPSFEDSTVNVMIVSNHRI